MNDASTTAAGLGALVGVGGGLLTPAVLQRLPAPEDELELRRSYSALAATRGLRFALCITSAVTCALLGLKLGWSAALPGWLYLGAAGNLLAVIDWRIRRLPAGVVNPSQIAIALGLAAAAAATSDWASLLRGVAGWAVAGGVLLVGWLVQPGTLGYGDVRLAALLGMALTGLSWTHLSLAFFLALLSAAGAGGVLAVTGRLDADHHMPLGPFLIAGAVVTVLLGSAIS